MATIQAAGIGSGLDINSIVSQLMAIERQPVSRLDTKQSIAEAQISAFGSLKSKLSEFQTAMENLGSASSFKVFTATSNDEDLFTASATSAAAAGSYTVNVVELAQRDKIATKAYTDTNSVVGEGTLTLSVGADSFDVVIDGTNNSVLGLRNAINAASDNTGVTASIVNDDAGSHIVLTSNDTGLDNALTISAADTDGTNTDDAGLSSLAYDVGAGVVHRPAISTALDAIVEIDGFTVTSSSNTITGAMEGLSITAKAKGTSTIDVVRDDEKITESAQAFADSYNALRTEIDAQRKGQLEADSTLLSIENQMSDILNSGSAVTGSNFSYLTEVGLSRDEFGKMSLDTDKLTEVLNTDFNSFANFFSAPDEGIAFRLEALAKSLTSSDGMIEAREDGLKTRVDSYEDQKLRLESRLVSVERRIRAQFSAMDSLVSSLNATGNFLSQQLATMPAAG